MDLCVAVGYGLRSEFRISVRVRVFYQLPHPHILLADNVVYLVIHSAISVHCAHIKIGLM